jgi:DNA-binding Lrp family transcriptional regulator
MKMIVDDLDRKIVRYICNGVYSYEELGKLCNASRNTVYRRIDNLEKMGIVEKRIMAFPNFEKLNLSAVIFGMNVGPGDIDRTINFLKRQHQVKFLWKTYGTHDIVFTIICDKGDVGTCIYNLKSALQKLEVAAAKLDSSTSVSWEKVDLSPY